MSFNHLISTVVNRVGAVQMTLSNNPTAKTSILVGIALQALGIWTASTCEYGTFEAFLTGQRTSIYGVAIGALGTHFIAETISLLIEPALGGQQTLPFPALNTIPPSNIRAKGG